MFVAAAKGAGAKVTHIITVSVPWRFRDACSASLTICSFAQQEGMPHDFTAQWWFAGAVRRLFLQTHTWIDGVKMAGEA